ncbi:hypothetical protein [Streptomyces sioyaensis]|uniref:hypothetical protein n=1 Tax=Streptomyces sioyaensis TaxID=67364 RepID=UPI00371D1D91
MTETTQQSLDTVGGITKALLNALDQVQNYVAASQVGPDGKPSGTAVYMHMPMGYPVDPKMFSNAWSPGGGSSSAQFDADGTFVGTPAANAPAGGTPAAEGTAPAGAVYPPPKEAADPVLQNSIQTAMYTAQLVDNMLEITKNGVASAWPEHRVSVEYFTVLSGMQPVMVGEPDQKVLDAVAAAQKVLYLQDAKGNLVGYTPLYSQYRKNQKAWTDAVAAQAHAYAQAMADPVAGQSWPVESVTYATAVTQAKNDFDTMGRRQVEDALHTISTVGENAIAALVDQAHQLYDSYTIQLGGQVSVGIPWSYISPISWWDHTDDSFGIQKIDATTDSYSAAGGSGTSSYANNWWNEQSSSTSGSAGIDVGLWGGSVDASHSDASNAFSDRSGSSGWEHHQDVATSATVHCEFFLASIERPWLLGDLLHMDGWYLVGHPKNSISDGTVEGQLKDDSKILPLLPKGFVIMRNVTIEADDWGSAADTFDNAQSSDSGGGQSSSDSFGASVSYLCADASVQHSEQQAGGAFGADSSSNRGWSFRRSGNGGTLSLTGSQIIGWVGEIQPASPKVDAPPVTAAAAGQPATTPGS